MGSGHNGEPPEAEDVLNCLVSDAQGLENARTFEEWCSEYGYDPDSRTAERIYKAVEKQVPDLKAFLGSDFQTVLELKGL